MPPSKNGNGLSGALGHPVVANNSFVARSARFCIAMLGHLYGFIVLARFIYYTFKLDKRFYSMNKLDKEELAAARKRLWDLDLHPYGMTHSFCELKDGTKLHYVWSKPENIVEGETGLTIFLHGYPDSWYLWHHLLKSANLKQNSVLIAVDLPSHGGSDSLARYDDGAVMEVMTEFILNMRKLHLTEGEKGRGPVIIAGHDWGALIGFKLAAEAPLLADRYVMSNSFHEPIVRANITSRFTSAIRMVKTWVRDPGNIRPLHAIYPTVKPVLQQLAMSGYVFMFRLPWPLGALMGRVGDYWFFRVINSMSSSYRTTEPLAGAQGWDMLASTIGPGKMECSKDGPNVEPPRDDPRALAQPLRYPAAVKKRLSTGGYFEKIRLYRDGAATGTWEKSISTVWELNELEANRRPLSSAVGSPGGPRLGSRVGLFNTGPPGTFGAPMTILWGQKDQACNQTIAVGGISDFFGVQPSHLVLFPQVGHWTPHHPRAVQVWEAVIHWSLTGERETMAQLLERYDEATLAVAV